LHATRAERPPASRLLSKARFKRLAKHPVKTTRIANNAGKMVEMNILVLTGKGILGALRGRLRVRALSRLKSLHRLWASCAPSFFLCSFCELPRFVFDEYLSSVAARVWGCQTALAGVWLCALILHYPRVSFSLKNVPPSSEVFPVHKNPSERLFSPSTRSAITPSIGSSIALQMGLQSD
jgi:hypothetical protein